MNLNTLMLLAGLASIIILLSHRFISSEIKKGRIDQEIRDKLNYAKYYILPDIFDVLAQQYTPEQLARVQRWINQAQTEIATKRKPQQRNEDIILAAHQAYIDVEQPFDKVFCGLDLIKDWNESRGRRQWYSVKFKEAFDETIETVRIETTDLARELYDEYLAQSRSGNDISFEKLRLLISSFNKLCFPADWVDLVGNFVDCPSLSDYGRRRDGSLHEIAIEHPSKTQLRQVAIKAIEEKDHIMAKLCLAYADATGSYHIPLEEHMRFHLGLVVHQYNHRKSSI